MKTHLNFKQISKKEKIMSKTNKELEKQIIAQTIISLLKSKDSPLLRYLIPEHEAENCGMKKEEVACSFSKLVELLREKYDLTSKQLSYSHIYPSVLFNANLTWDDSGFLADLDSKKPALPWYGKCAHHGDGYPDQECSCENWICDACGVTYTNDTELSLITEKNLSGITMCPNCISPE